MIPWWGLAVGILGVNFVLWGSASLCRLAGTMPRRGPCPQRPGRAPWPQRPGRAPVPG